MDDLEVDEEMANINLNANARLLEQQHQQPCMQMHIAVQQPPGAGDGLCQQPMGGQPIQAGNFNQVDIHGGDAIALQQPNLQAGNLNQGDIHIHQGNVGLQEPNPQAGNANILPQVNQQLVPGVDKIHNQQPLARDAAGNQPGGHQEQTGANNNNILQERNDNNKGRGVRGGNTTKRAYYREKFNPYHRGLENMAVYFAKQVAASNKETAKENAKKAKKRDKAKREDKEKKE